MNTGRSRVCDILLRHAGKLDDWMAGGELSPAQENKSPRQPRKPDNLNLNPLHVTKMTPEEQQEISTDVERQRKEVQTNKYETPEDGYSVVYTWNIGGWAGDAPEEYRVYDPIKGQWLAKDLPGIIWVPPAPPHASPFGDAQPDYWANQVAQALVKSKEIRERFFGIIAKRVNEIYPGEEFSIPLPEGKVLLSEKYAPTVMRGDLRREAEEFLLYLRTAFPLAQITDEEMVEFEKAFNHDIGME